MAAKSGMTLMEICVIMIIVSLTVIFTLPGTVVPLERAHSLSALNNLMSIYAAQKNYINENNNSTYCTANVPNPQATQCVTWGVAAGSQCGDTLVDLNCNLNLHVQDEGYYTYSCANAAPGFSCTATRTGNFNGTNNNLTITINNNNVLNVDANTNPVCASTTGNNNWCPN